MNNFRIRQKWYLQIRPDPQPSAHVDRSSLWSNSRFCQVFVSVELFSTFCFFISSQTYFILLTGSIAVDFFLQKKFPQQIRTNVLIVGTVPYLAFSDSCCATCLSSTAAVNSLIIQKCLFYGTNKIIKYIGQLRKCQ